jgi:hypothetical protein
MAIVLILVCISIVLTTVTALLLSEALQPTAPGALPEIRQPEANPRFFQSSVPLSLGGAASPVPVEVLLLQIERHVRLEQAAAESFHLFPTPQSLHVHTASPLMH